MPYHTILYMKEKPDRTQLEALVGMLEAPVEDLVRISHGAAPRGRDRLVRLRGGRLLELRRHHVNQRDVEAGKSRDMGNAIAHLTGADDSDRVDHYLDPLRKR